MKKFYAFFAAALMSVSVFAAKDVVPSDAVLADYYDAGQVCMCFFVPADMACYDAVVTGSFNGWSGNLDDCIAAEPVEGFDGWYVAAFTPEEEPDAVKGIQAKPIMKDGDGNFNWEYQVGAATKIRGGVEVVQGGYAGEIDLINYGVDAPNVFTVDAWKQNPCTAEYHVYTFTVISDGCDGFAVPFIVGGFTGWSFEQMQLDIEKTVANGYVPTYVYTKKLAEESPFQIVSGLMDENGDIAEQPAWSDDSYLQKLVDDVWARIPGENGENLLTHENPEIVFDLRDADLRWGRCDGAVAEEVVVNLKAPAGAPESIEIIGSFDGWTGQAMELVNGVWTATVSAKPAMVFKFREAGNWDNQIVEYDEDNDVSGTFGDNDYRSLVFEELWEGEEGARTINLDFSDPDKYSWSATTGIENIVLTKEAQKVVVDGVLYIVRDNKLFNVQGTQVR